MNLNESDIFDGLNDQQKQAVKTVQGPLLIVAGPGTGKTSTLVHRIAYLAHQGISPDSILAVTFTNRAAREMKERTEALLGSAASKIFIGTFHLLGLRIIRESGNHDFSILSADEQTDLLKPMMNGSAKKAREAADRISRVKNYVEEAGEIQEILAAYQAELLQRNAFDFDDLIHVPIGMLQDRAAAHVYQKRFKYIIVDEYQDINPAQYRLLRLLVGSSRNICAVGDPDQAIYAFRGADLQNFLNFEQDFPGASRITLTQNYRSTGFILKAADNVIRNNQKRIDKELVATRDEDEAVSVVSVPDERSEGSAIIDEIEARMGGTSRYRQLNSMVYRGATERSYRFSDFAVIYRTNAQARALEDAFSASGIPFQVIGKRSSVQRREMEETVSFLRTLAYPEGAGISLSNDENTPEARLLTEADFFDPRADAVALMTMHAAKGLEFRVVFVAGCENGLVPCTIMKEDADLEEERRLFYVGLTRAKEELFLIAARSRFLYGQSLGQEVSPFVMEIPDEVKQSRIIADKIKKQKPEQKQMGLF